MLDRAPSGVQQPKKSFSWKGKRGKQRSGGAVDRGLGGDSESKGGKCAVM